MRGRVTKSTFLLFVGREGRTSEAYHFELNYNLEIISGFQLATLQKQDVITNQKHFFFELVSNITDQNKQMKDPVPSAFPTNPSISSAFLFFKFLFFLFLSPLII